MLVQPELRGSGPPRELRLVLPGAPATIRGRVVDQRRTPIAGAWTRAGELRGMAENEFDHHAQPPPGAIATSADDGGFELRMLRAGPQRLRVYRSGFQPYDAIVELLPHEVRDIVIVLTEGATLSGVVRDADGAPVAREHVSLEDSWHPGPWGASTDADGAFSVSDLPTGVDCEFVVTVSGHATLRRTFRFAPREHATWEVDLTVGTAVRGRLVDERGAPLVGWFVDSDRHERRAKTTADGRFVLTDTTAVAHRLAVRPTVSFRPIITTFEDVWPSENEVLLVVRDDAMPSARVRGRCTAPDGTPLCGIRIAMKQGRWPVIPGGEPLSTDEHGRFVTPELPPGTYTFHAQHADHAFAPRTVEVTARQDLDLGELRAGTR